MRYKTKNVLAFLLALLILLSLSACGKPKNGNTDSSSESSGDTPYDNMMAAVNKVSSANGASIEISSNLNFNIDDEEINVSATGISMHSLGENGELQFVKEQEFDTKDQIINLNYSYQDGFLFTSVWDDQYKKPLPQDEALKMLFFAFLSFDSKDIVEESAVQVDDNTEITIRVKGEAMTDFMNTQSEKALEFIGATTDIIYFSDVQITALVTRSQNLLSFAANAGFLSVDEELNITGNFDVKATNISYGDIKIDLPTDLDSYVDDSNADNKKGDKIRLDD